MSAHAYTEDQLVEQPAIGFFAELGWATVSTKENMSSPSLVRIDQTAGRIWAGCLVADVH